MEEDEKLIKEYDDLTDKIKKLDITLGKIKTSLKSSKIAQNDVSKINNEIKEIERQINYHIFARNKVSDKLYGSEVKNNGIK